MLVERLLELDAIEIQPNSLERVAQVLAHDLARVQHGSLVSSTSKSLLSCEEVDELYLDDDALKRVIDDLPPHRIRGR